MDVIKAVVTPLADMLKADPQISPYFHYSDSWLFARRLSHFYAHLAGGSEEWIGKPVEQAHQGRFITNEHFDVLLNHTEHCFRANNVKESCIVRFMELIEKMRFLIVFQEE